MAGLGSLGGPIGLAIAWAYYLGDVIGLHGD